MFKIVPVFIGVCFLLVIGGWILAASIAVKSIDYVEKNGLKSVVNHVWEGENSSQAVKP